MLNYAKKNRPIGRCNLATRSELFDRDERRNDTEAIDRMFDDDFSATTDVSDVELVGSPVFAFELLPGHVAFTGLLIATHQALEARLGGSGDVDDQVLFERANGFLVRGPAHSIEEEELLLHISRLRNERT